MAKDKQSIRNTRMGEAYINAVKKYETDSGSADTRERGAIRKDLTDKGFDGEAFKELIDAELKKLKPGQKTLWNPGRLPNGGKIAADGTYVPPDMVREDDRKRDDYYRKRREEVVNNLLAQNKPRAATAKETAMAKEGYASIKKHYEAAGLTGNYGLGSDIFDQFIIGPGPSRPVITKEIRRLSNGKRQG